MRVAVCDDCFEDLERVCKIARDKFDHVIPYDNPVLLVNDISDNVIYDLFLLDINMPNISGHQIRDAINKSNNDACIIYITDHEELMQISFGRNVVAFIHKNEIDTELPKKLDELKMEINRYILVRNNHYTIKFTYNDILYIKSSDIYSEIHYKKNDCIECMLVRKSLNEWESELDKTEFYRVSRFVIVNFYYVVTIDKIITVSDGQQFKMKHGQIRNIKKAYLNYLRTKTRYL